MKLGAPLIVGCVMIASMVLVQATAITAIVRLVRRQVPRANTVAQWVHNVGVFTRALLLIEIGKSTRLNSSHYNISYAVFCLTAYEIL